MKVFNSKKSDQITSDINSTYYWLEPLIPLFLGLQGNLWLLIDNNAQILAYIIVNAILLIGILSLFIKRINNKFMNSKYVIFSFSGLILIFIDGGVGSFFTIWLFVLPLYLSYLDGKEGIFFSILIPLLYLAQYPFSTVKLHIFIVLQRVFVIAIIGLFAITLIKTLVKIAVEKETLANEEREEHRRRMEQSNMNEELAKLNYQLQKSNKDLEDFAFVASHDLKAPLTKIILAVESINQELTNNQDEVLKMISKLAKQMNDLITDLLSYSKISEEKFLQEVDLNIIIIKVKENLSNDISTKNAQIIYENLPIIKANQSLMISLFQNLIQNGIKFNKSILPTIKIMNRYEGDNLILSVNDNGIGIPQENKDSIFEIFKRFDVDNEFTGTGIGLALCKRIVEQYEGQIWVDSTIGKGSTFFIKLPLKY